MKLPTSAYKSKSKLLVVLLFYVTNIATIFLSQEAIAKTPTHSHNIPAVELTSAATDSYHPALQRNQIPSFYSYDWFDRIHFSGLIMGEIIASTYNQGGTKRFNEHSSYSTFCFPRAGLYMDADVNEWAAAHAAFNFSPTSCCSDACGFGLKNDEFRFTTFDKVDES